MEADLERGMVIFDEQSHEIAPFHGKVIWVWDRQDLIDVLAFFKTISIGPVPPDAERRLLSPGTQPFVMVNISDSAQVPIYVAWLPAIAKIELGYPVQTLLVVASEHIAVATLDTAMGAGYNPTEGSVMYRNLVSSLLFDVLSMLSRRLKGKICYASLPVMYLQQHVAPRTLTEMQHFSAAKIQSMVHDETMRTENGQVNWHDKGLWSATTYFY